VSTTLPHISLLAALDDRQLLGSAGLQHRPRQRELLAAVERGPRVHVVAAGRRGGKSTTGAVALVWDAILRSHLQGMVRPGERRYSIAVSTTLRQARLLLAAARSLIESSPMLAALVESVSEDELLLRGGSAIACFPCTSRGGRGWPVSCLVMDEAAHFVDTEGNASAASVWRALSPSLAQFGDDARAFVCSTPWGDSGTFADWYRRADSGAWPGAVAHHATSAELNPSLSAAFLDAERASDPEAFASEYLAEFRAGGRQLFDSDAVRACTDAGVSELPPGSLVAPIAAVDLAFSRDASALSIVGWDRGGGGGGLLRQALVRRWQPSPGRPLVFSDVLAEVIATCKAYGVRRVALDQFAAAAVVDHLRRAGLVAVECPTTAQSRASMFLGLRRRISDQRIRLLDDPRQQSELARVERGYQSGGVVQILLPRSAGGGHCDAAVALALAVSQFPDVRSGGLRISSPRHHRLPERPSMGGADRRAGA
jgi:hypothetical protein